MPTASAKDIIRQRIASASPEFQQFIAQRRAGREATPRPMNTDMWESPQDPGFPAEVPRDPNWDKVVAAVTPTPATDEYGGAALPDTMPNGSEPYPMGPLQAYVLPDGRKVVLPSMYRPPTTWRAVGKPVLPSDPLYEQLVGSYVATLGMEGVMDQVHTVSGQPVSILSDIARMGDEQGTPIMSMPPPAPRLAPRNTL